jgi:hypothetical protein
MSDEIRNRFFGRRQFLLGVGGHVLLLPLLSSMLPQALAQAVQPRRRLGMFPLELGLHNSYLRPDPAVLMPLMQTHKAGIRYAPLANVPKPLSFMVDNSYNDLVSQMNIIQGLDFMQQNSHTHGIFCGVAQAVIDGHNNRIPVWGKTIDIMVEQSAAFKASFSGKIPTLRMSPNLTQYSATDTTMSVDRAADGTALPQPFLRGDTNVFNKLFGGTMSTSGTPIAARKMLVTDSVLADLNRLKNHRRISSEDKNMLDRYITGIDEVQRNLLKNTPVCTTPAISYQIQANGAPIANGTPEKFYDNIWEMAALAFACDQSRMVMVMNTIGGNDFGKLCLHHEGDDIENFGTDRLNWYVKQVSNFARKLQNFPDPSGGGSLLDNSLLMIVNEHSGRRAHSANDLPVLTFGKLGGAVRSGNFIEYIHRKDNYGNYGYPMKQMLITAMEAMGVTKSAYMAEGDGYGYGQWGPWGETYYSALKATHNDPLPFFTSGT